MIIPGRYHNFFGKNHGRSDAVQQCSGVNQERTGLFVDLGFFPGIAIERLFLNMSISILTF